MEAARPAVIVKAAPVPGNAAALEWSRRLLDRLAASGTGILEEQRGAADGRGNPAKAFGEAAEEVFEETRAHSDLARRIDDSYRQALETVGKWLTIADGEYAIQRNRVLGI